MEGATAVSERNNRCPAGTGDQGGGVPIRTSRSLRRSHVHRVHRDVLIALVSPAPGRRSGRYLHFGSAPRARRARLRGIYRAPLFARSSRRPGRLRGRVRGSCGDWAARVIDRQAARVSASSGPASLLPHRGDNKYLGCRFHCASAQVMIPGRKPWPRPAWNGYAAPCSRADRSGCMAPRRLKIQSPSGLRSAGCMGIATPSAIRRWSRAGPDKAAPRPHR